MSSVLEGGEHLERELTPEPIARPAIGSVVLHGVLIAALVAYGLVRGMFHPNIWGTQGAGGAMQVNLVSTAIPLPNNQPVNKNVLTTEKPSPAPAPPSPKEQAKVDEKAIPILGKQVKPMEQTAPKTQPHQPTPETDNQARYGEQQQDGEQLVQAGGRSAHTKGCTRLPGFYDSPGWQPVECAAGSIERKPDAGSLVRARGAARGHLWFAAACLHTEHAQGFLLL